MPCQPKSKIGKSFQNDTKFFYYTRLTFRSRCVHVTRMIVLNCSILGLPIMSDDEPVCR